MSTNWQMSSPAWNESSLEKMGTWCNTANDVCIYVVVEVELIKCCYYYVSYCCIHVLSQGVESLEVLCVHIMCFSIALCIGAIALITVEH